MPSTKGPDVGTSPARVAAVSRCQAQQPRCGAGLAAAAQVPLQQGFRRRQPEGANASRREQAEHAGRASHARSAQQRKKRTRRWETRPFPRRKPSSAQARERLARSTELLVYQRITEDSVLLAEPSE